MQMSFSMGYFATEIKIVCACFYELLETLIDIWVNSNQPCKHSNWILRPNHDICTFSTKPFDCNIMQSLCKLQILKKISRPRTD